MPGKYHKNEMGQQRKPESHDAYEPGLIAEKVLSVGVKKVRYPIYKTLILGIMGGGFISMGALFELYMYADPFIETSTGAVLGPLFYALGYVLAFISGAQIFTTNNLAVMGAATGKISLLELTKNWTIVLVANIIGAATIVVLFYFSGLIYQFDFGLIDVAKTLTSQKLHFYTGSDHYHWNIWQHYDLCRFVAGNERKISYRSICSPLPAGCRCTCNEFPAQYRQYVPVFSCLDHRN